MTEAAIRARSEALEQNVAYWRSPSGGVATGSDWPQHDKVRTTTQPGRECSLKNTEDDMSLHDKIMNIPLSPSNKDGVLVGYIDANGIRPEYKYGHRDARHAAAELAANYEAEVAIELGEKDRIIRELIDGIDYLLNKPPTCADNSTAIFTLARAKQHLEGK